MSEQYADGTTDQTVEVEQAEERAEQRNATKDRDTEREKMRVMGLWLDAVCAELGVDRALVERVTKPALGLISDVAHGPSRPGAPMTAFVVGLASAAGDGEDAITERIGRLIELARTWEAPDGPDDADPDDADPDAEVAEGIA